MVDDPTYTELRRIALEALTLALDSVPIPENGPTQYLQDSELMRIVDEMILGTPAQVRWLMLQMLVSVARNSEMWEPYTVFDIVEFLRGSVPVRYNPEDFEGTGWKFLLDSDNDDDVEQWRVECLSAISRAEGEAILLWLRWLETWPLFQFHDSVLDAAQAFWRQRIREEPL